MITRFLESQLASHDPDVATRPSRGEIIETAKFGEDHVSRMARVAAEKKDVADAYK